MTTKLSDFWVWLNTPFSNLPWWHTAVAFTLFGAIIGVIVAVTEGAK